MEEEKKQDALRVAIANSFEKVAVVLLKKVIIGEEADEGKLGELLDGLVEETYADIVDALTPTEDNRMVQNTMDDPEGLADFMEKYILGSNIMDLQVLNGVVRIRTEAGGGLVFDMNEKVMKLARVIDKNAQPAPVTNVIQ